MSLTDFYATRTPIVWHILGVCFLQIWGVGVVFNLSSLLSSGKTQWEKDFRYVGHPESRTEMKVELVLMKVSHLKRSSWDLGDAKQHRHIRYILALVVERMVCIELSFCCCCGPLNRLNAILSLLHPLDCYRTPSAIGSAIGRPLSRPISHPNTGGSPQPPRSKPLRGLNRAIVAL